MEGQGAVGDRQHPCPVPHGGRQGDDEQGGEVPVASGPARAVAARRLGTARRKGGIGGVGGITWGTHVCHFYEKEDALVPTHGSYFKTRPASSELFALGV